MACLSVRLLPWPLLIHLPGSRMSISSETIRKSPTKLTYNEYVLFPDDGKRHEIIDGKDYMHALSVARHQAISRHIQFQLYLQIEQAKLG